ncbi:putative heat-labile enterotoxin [Ophiocordyceps camponoti-leonardi (nom. inval.)]|nr:putative heat-labile enterotoxin [Ophiocordyceps camponoti-leonardi (nom. inval.)]
MRCQQVLCLALLTLACPSSCHSYTFSRQLQNERRGSSSIPPRTVYRADRIHPMDLELQGGFLPRGLDGSRHNRLSLDFSLYNHVLGTRTGSSKSNSAFVATSKTERAARRILSLTFNDVGFIYSIHVTSNFYDVEGTLGGYYMHTIEEEVAALGKIQFGQVLGWIEFRQGVEQPYVKNHKYDHKLFDTEEWAGAEYRIAGFPENHVAWRQEPWRSARESRRPSCAPSRKRDVMSCDSVQPKQPEGESLSGEEKEINAEAERLFTEFASKFGLVTRATVSWRMPLPEVRERFKTSGQRMSPPANHRTRWWSPGAVAANAAVSGQSIFDITSSGAKMMSVSDRAAILMSVLPGVGCSFQAWADEAHGVADPSDALLCVAADVLMMQGIGLPLIAMIALRSVRRRYLTSKMPSWIEMRQLRDKSWETYQESMMSFIKSADFGIVCSNHFMAEMAGVMFEAAEALSRLRVAKRQALSNPTTSFEEKWKMRVAFDKEESTLRSHLSAQAWKRHRRLKSDLPLMIKTSLRRQASDFNEIFISNFQYDVKNNKYEPWADWGITTINLERRARAVVWHLRNSLPETPGLGEIKHRVHKALAYLETPSLCTEYRPNGSIKFHCGNPSDGDHYIRGRARCDDEACTVYRPPEYQSGCELGYTYDKWDKKCRLSTSSSSSSSVHRATWRWGHQLQLRRAFGRGVVTMGLLRFLVMGNHFAIFISSLIVTGILSYFIHRSSYRDTHIIFQEVIAVITFVLWLFGMLLPLVDRYKGHLMPVNLLLSYLWLTAFIFAAQDWSGDRCYDGPPILENCGKKHTAEAFMFLTFFFLLCNTVAEAMLWRSIPRDAEFSKTGTARGVDNTATTRV